MLFVIDTYKNKEKIKVEPTVIMIYTLNHYFTNIHISLIVSFVSLSGGFFTMKHEVREG